MSTNVTGEAGSGALLWGFGRVVGREAPHLQPRMIDLDPERGVAYVHSGQRADVPGR